jgi:hypothetical protein
MISDDQLSHLLKAALPAVDAAGPPLDLCSAVVRRGDARIEVSPADWSLAVIVVLVLLMFPEWFWFLAYHL